MDLQTICNSIIILGTAFFTVEKIIDSIAKPASRFKKRKKAKIKDDLKTALDDIIPNYLLEHDKKLERECDVRAKHHQTVIKEEINSEIKEELDQIMKVNLEQNQLLETMREGTKDIMRQRIMVIYRNYRKLRVIPYSVKEELDQLYKDYKRLFGNSYIDRHYSKMKEWTIVEENDII